MKMSRHPNVVEYITSYVTNDEIWVVMEFMDMALSDILSLESNEEEEEEEGEERSGSFILLEESLIARIARDILRALTRIHRLNRIHRDIRSDNILLNLRGDVKLSKLSNKKCLAVTNPKKTADFSQCAQLTKTKPKRNSIVGTPYWMAPELIKGKDYDTKIDIWSLGVLIYEMAQNNPPYIEHPPLKALYLIASHGLPALTEKDRWSDNFKDFLALCTTMDPEKRPDTSVLLKVGLLMA
jgi:serine/threonine protein kinase